MYAYCRSVYTRHLRDLYGVDRHWWPGKRAPSARNGLRITVYGVHLHSTYKPGFRDQESYHTILDISFDTRYLYIAHVSSDWSLIHSIIEVSRYHQVSISNVHKYRDTSIYRVSNQHYSVPNCTPQCKAYDVKTLLYDHLCIKVTLPIPLCDRAVRFHARNPEWNL